MSMVSLLSACRFLIVLVITYQSTHCVNGQSNVITTDKNLYNFDESITIRWNYTDVNDYDWIGIYPNGAPIPLSWSYQMWVYVYTLNQSTFFPGVRPVGSVMFNGNDPYEVGHQIWPLAPGLYKAHIARAANYEPFSVVTSSSTFQVKSPSSGHSLCFSAWNTVNVKDKGNVPINQLKIGDYVKSGKNDDDYTQVYGFGHYGRDWEDDFLQIHFHENTNSSHPAVLLPAPLEISYRHLVFVERNHKQSTMQASDIKVGDELVGPKSKVQSIRTVRRRGVYAPLTYSGDIVVSGVRASNYVHVLDLNGSVWDHHTIAHILFFPQRLFCTFFLDTCKKETYTEGGYGWFAYFIVNIGSSVNDHGGWAFLFLLLLSMPTLAILYAMEATANVDKNRLVMAIISVLILKRSKSKKIE
jgi:Hint module